MDYKHMTAWRLPTFNMACILRGIRELHAYEQDKDNAWRVVRFGSQNIDLVAHALNCSIHGFLVQWELIILRSNVLSGRVHAADPLLVLQRDLHSRSPVVLLELCTL